MVCQSRTHGRPPSAGSTATPPGNKMGAYASKGVSVVGNTRQLTGLAVVIAAALGTIAAAQRPSSGSDGIRIPFESYTLANGLTVITSLDRTTPTVAVNVWYHVGSKNEVA